MQYACNCNEASTPLVLHQTCDGDSSEVDSSDGGSSDGDSSESLLSPSLLVMVIVVRVIVVMVIVVRVIVVMVIVVMVIRMTNSLVSYISYFSGLMLIQFQIWYMILCE